MFLKTGILYGIAANDFFSFEIQDVWQNNSFVFECEDVVASEYVQCICTNDTITSAIEFTLYENNNTQSKYICRLVTVDDNVDENTMTNSIHRILFQLMSI